MKASAARSEPAPTALVATTDVGLWLRLLESHNRILAELRRADKADRRLSRVHLTARGRALVAAVVPLHAEHLSRLLGGLDGKERRDLHRLLGKLRDSLRAKERR